VHLPDAEIGGQALEFLVGMDTLHRRGTRRPAGKPNALERDEFGNFGDTAREMSNRIFSAACQVFRDPLAYKVGSST